MWGEGLDLGQDFILCPPGDTPLLADGRLRKAYATWEGRVSKSAKGSFRRRRLSAKGAADRFEWILEVVKDLR